MEGRVVILKRCWEVQQRGSKQGLQKRRALTRAVEKMPVSEPVLSTFNPIFDSETLAWRSAFSVVSPGTKDEYASPGTRELGAARGRHDRVDVARCFRSNRASSARCREVSEARGYLGAAQRRSPRLVRIDSAVRGTREGAQPFDVFWFGEITVCSNILLLAKT